MIFRKNGWFNFYKLIQKKQRQKYFPEQTFSTKISLKKGRTKKDTFSMM
jgi:hypothetical protein